jgi:hypothetical protein
LPVSAIPSFKTIAAQFRLIAERQLQFIILGSATLKLPTGILKLRTSCLSAAPSPASRPSRFSTRRIRGYQCGSLIPWLTQQATMRSPVPRQAWFQHTITDASFFQRRSGPAASFVFRMKLLHHERSKARCRFPLNPVILVAGHVLADSCVVSPYGELYARSPSSQI